MRKRLLAAAAVLAMMVGGLVFAAASPASAHCSGHGTHPDLYSAGGISWGNGTAIRRQPHIGCPALGRGYPNQGIDVHCAVTTGADWVYARDTSTGINGWAREDALRIDGVRYVPYCTSLTGGDSTAAPTGLVEIG